MKNSGKVWISIVLVAMVIWMGLVTNQTAKNAVIENKTTEIITSLQTAKNAVIENKITEIISSQTAKNVAIENKITKITSSQTAKNVVIENKITEITSSLVEEVKLKSALPLLIQRVKSSVVKIDVNTPGIRYSGSGVMISKGGLILTAGHMIIDSKYMDVNDITITFIDGTTATVSAVYKEDDKVVDLGLMQISMPNDITFNVACFGDAVLGEDIFAIGEPFEFFQTVSHGIVSALNVKDSFFGSVKLLQTDCPLNPGNSGGPLFNMEGQVIAICVCGIHNSDGMGFCVPTNVCKLVIKKYFIEEELSRL